MKKLLLALLLPISAWAQLDYSAQSLVRSYPIGFFASATSGYGLKLWDKKDVNPAFYGYVRPSITAQTSLVVNQAKLELEVAPVAFARFYAGAALVNRDFNDLDTFDCDQVTCRAKMLRQYVGFKMAIKVKSFFLMTDHRFERVKTSEKRGVFAEEMGTLLGANGDDVLRVNQLILGYELDERWAIGTLVIANAMEKFINSSRMQVGFVQHKMGKFTVLAGAGTFHTRTNSDVFSTLVLLQWAGDKGITLF